MPIKMINVTDAPDQRHTVLLNDSELVVRLRHFSTVGMWAVSVEYKGEQANGYRLAVDTLHMVSRNFPFDFVVRDASGVGLDPVRLDDFKTGRCELYVLDADDMEAYRGGPVPI